MITHQLIQGSEAWLLHRNDKCNASDAPAMLGCSPYKTRSQLLHERATGVTQEVDSATQRRFDDGHRFEELARPLAEKIIGDELFPCTGSEGKLSASFDGLTMDGSIGFEHKTLNDELRSMIPTGVIPDHYRLQLEQQHMVSGCEKILFMASKWDGETLLEELHCWYYPDAELRDRIMQGWCQFAKDLETYEFEPAKAAPVAKLVEGFGALSLRIEGRVLASNLDAFRAGAEAFIARLPKPDDLQTDQDFADAEASVKACAEAESRIKAAKDSAQAQMTDVDSAFRLADSVIDMIRAARLGLGKVVKTEKEARKAAIVRDGVDAVREHYTTINATLKAHTLGIPASLTADVGASIKGLRTIKSICDAVDTAVANIKIEVSKWADSVRACIAVMDECAKGHESLFADRVALCASKQPDDLRNLVRLRISEHEQREAARIEQERERIRAEELAKIERDRIEAEQVAAERHAQAKPVDPVAPEPKAASSAPATKATPPRPTDSQIVKTVAGEFNVATVIAERWILDVKPAGQQQENQHG